VAAEEGKGTFAPLRHFVEGGISVSMFQKFTRLILQDGIQMLGCTYWKYLGYIRIAILNTVQVTVTFDAIRSILLFDTLYLCVL